MGITTLGNSQNILGVMVVAKAKGLKMIALTVQEGGKGTRIASVAKDIPKPMIQICGKLILQYQIECLKKQGKYGHSCFVAEVTGNISRGLKKALDRDGTTNIYKGFINNAEEFELIPGIAEIIKKINVSSYGYLALVVTNQPVIARGECSLEELKRIYEKMVTLLGQEDVQG